MHWLAEHVKKSAKDQYAKYFWVIAVEFKEAAKFCLEVSVSNSKVSFF